MSMIDTIGVWKAFILAGTFNYFRVDFISGVYIFIWKKVSLSKDQTSVWDENAFPISSHI